MVSTKTKMTDEYTLLKRIYDFNDDSLMLEVFFDSNGLMLRSNLGRLGGSVTIPLIPDTYWSFRHNRHPAVKPTTALRDLINELTGIANWVDAHPNEGLSSYAMLHKLRNEPDKNDWAT